MTYRFQHKRVAGFRSPPGGFVAGRNSHLGNVYTVEEFGHAEAVRLHREDALADRLRSPKDGRHIPHAYIRRFRKRRPRKRKAPHFYMRGEKFREETP